MGLFSMLSKGLKAMVDDVNTPESFKIGQKFEDYVREFLFIESYYTMLERTHDYNSNSRDYVKSSLKPDFKFRDKWAKKDFYVEAKFRSNDFKGKIIWCNETQLKRYQQISKECPVFLILGIGGDPKFPESLSLLPLYEAKYTGLFSSFIEKFEVDLDEAISSKMLWTR